MVWTKGKLSIPRAKTLAFQNLPSPNTPKKAKLVICALSYFRKFVPSFAQLSQPIMDISLLRPKEFKWTEKHENLFRRLIKKYVKIQQDICQIQTNLTLHKLMHLHFAEQENFSRKTKKEMNF